MKKSIFLTVLFFLAVQYTFADQLAWLTQVQATKAERYLKRQKEVLLFCACCKGDTKEYFELASVSVRDTGTEGYFQIYLTGKGNGAVKKEVAVDLAYVFVNMNGKARCLGQVLRFECDPCTQPFPWKEKEKAVDASKTETLVFKNAERISGGDYFLTFHYPNRPTKLVVFPLTMASKFEGDYRFFDEELMVNKRLLGATFAVTYKSGMRENEIGEMEKANILLKLRKLYGGNADARTSRPTQRREKGDDEQMKYRLSHKTTEGIKMYCKQQGVDMVPVAVPDPESETGILPYQNLMPTTVRMKRLVHKMIGKDPCGAGDSYYSLYQQGTKGAVVVENGTEDNIFYFEEFKTEHFNLTAGMTKQEVIGLIGRPYMEKGKMIVYLSRDITEEPGMYSEPYYGALRLFFDNGKLVGIWIIVKKDC